MGKIEIVKLGVIYTLSSIILRCVSFFSVPLFIRLLTTEEFGRYNVFISYESIIFIFSALTIHASVKNAKFENGLNFDKFIQNCIYFDFSNSLILFVVFRALHPLCGQALDLTVFEVDILVLSGFCQAAITIYSSKLVMEFKSQTYLLVSIISVLVGICSSIVFICAVFDNHYTGRVLGGLLGQLAAAAFVIIQIFKNKRYKFDIKYILYGLRISLPIVPHGLSQIALGAANKIMINLYYSSSLAGIYSLTVTMSILPQVLFSSLSQVWEPWFFKTINAGNYDMLRKGSMYFLHLISFTYISMSVVAPEIIKLFATEEYLIAIDITIIILCGNYFATLYHIPCEIEYYYKKTSCIALSTFACGSLNVILNIILMPHFSFKIAAYVSLISYLLYFTFHLLMAIRIEKRNFFNLTMGVRIILLSVTIMITNTFLIEHVLIRYALLCIVLCVYMFIFKSEITILQSYIITKYVKRP